MKGWSEEEKMGYKTVIANNIITSMRTLCQACVDLKVGRHFWKSLNTSALLRWPSFTHTLGRHRYTTTHRSTGLKTAKTPPGACSTMTSSSRAES